MLKRICTNRDHVPCQKPSNVHNPLGLEPCPLPEAIQWAQPLGLEPCPLSETIQRVVCCIQCAQPLGLDSDNWLGGKIWIAIM